MTQVIAALHDGGIALATDSRAVRIQGGEADESLQVQKLFPLGRNAFILSAGIGLGIPLSLRYRSFVETRMIADGEDILSYAEPFLSRQYADLLARMPGPDDPYHRLFFLIGATGFGPPHKPHRMVLLAAEAGQLPLSTHEVEACITIPRSLGAEANLHRMCRRQSPLDEILAFAHRFLTKRSTEDEGVAPPFYWGRLTSQGLALGQWGRQGSAVGM